MSDHELPGMWESADFSGGEADTENERKQEADARRERYAAAIAAADDMRKDWCYAEADAAMAVADEESGRKDREYATCERLLRESYDENARLRAELEESRRKECDALCADVERDRDEYESTINRVRAVLETESVLNRTALEYRGLVCKAVYGAPDASS